jgi:DNA-binding CsgD family transcriptional regulator
MLITLHASHPYKGGVKPLSDALTLNGKVGKTNQRREALSIGSQGFADASSAENQHSCEALNDDSYASRGSTENEDKVVKRLDGFMKVDKGGSGLAPTNLREEIWRLKTEGKSLRAIATALGVSHEAVRKRLKGFEGKDRVSIQKTPPLPLSVSVNRSETLSDKLTGGKKGAFQGLLSEIDNLFEAIMEFLKSNGIEVYRMEVELEAYQVRHNDQIIRFYIQRKKTGVSQVP